jgi:hypothetical protein
MTPFVGPLFWQTRKRAERTGRLPGRGTNSRLSDWNRLPKYQRLAKYKSLRAPLLQLAIVLIEVDEKKPPKMWYSLLSISSFTGITAKNPKANHQQSDSRDDKSANECSP